MTIREMLEQQYLEEKLTHFVLKVSLEEFVARKFKEISETCNLVSFNNVNQTVDTIDLEIISQTGPVAMNNCTKTRAWISLRGPE